MNAKIIAALVGVGALVLSYIGLWYFSVESGYNQCSLENETYVSKQKDKIIKLQAKVQKFENERAEHTQSLAIVNKQRNEAINTIEAKREENKRIESKWRKALDQRDQALAANLHLIDVNHIQRVYSQAVNACDGLPGSERTYLVPIKNQQSTSQYVAETIKRIVSQHCSAAINYNSIYKSYQSALKAKVQKQ